MGLNPFDWTVALVAARPQLMPLRVHCPQLIFERAAEARPTANFLRKRGIPRDGREKVIRCENERELSVHAAAVND